MLPEPTLSLTLPSLHDDTVLSCRIYHPASQTPAVAASSPPPSSPPPARPLSSGARPARRRLAAIVAHPYAPMGGCYDDTVVGVVALALLRQGFLVGTFNFRGAPPSAGKTSWTAKPEVGDYMSFAGFMIYYIYHLDSCKRRLRIRSGHADPTSPALPLFPASPTSLVSPASPALPSSPVSSRSSQPAEDDAVLLMAGYSYGAVVTAMLPPLSVILQPLAEPPLGSAAAEIRLRALHLAEQQAALMSLLGPRPGTPPDRHSLGLASPHRTLCVRVGGDEAAGQRKSHEMQTHGHRSHRRRSHSVDGEDSVRRSVGEFLDRTKLRKRGHNGSGGGAAPAKVAPGTAAAAPVAAPAALEPVAGLVQPSAAYLLVSPLQGVVGHLLALSLPVLAPPAPHLLSKLARRWTAPGGDLAAVATVAPLRTPGPADPAERKLVENATLAVFGDRDRFSPVARLDVWAAKLAAWDRSRFGAERVKDAGHFWTEDGMAATLGGLVGRFARDVGEGGVESGASGTGLTGPTGREGNDGGRAVGNETGPGITPGYTP